MKKVIIIAFALLNIGLFAQKHKNKGHLGEKYQAQKVAYITSALDLTAEESAAFWPVYNEQDKKKKELSIEMRNYRSDFLEKEDDLTEEQAKEALEFIQNHMNEIHELELEYQKKYLDIITAKKVLNLMKAEKDFRRELLKKLGERRNQRGRR